MHYLPQDLRRKLMVECPAAYNELCGRDVVAVVHSDDWRRVGMPVTSSPVVPEEVSP
jgi:hypothetical protein